MLSLPWCASSMFRGWPAPHAVQSLPSPLAAKSGFDQPDIWFIVHPIEVLQPKPVPATQSTQQIAEERVAFAIRDRLPREGLFAGHEWRVATEPFRLSGKLADEIQALGRILLQFYRAANLLYRKSIEGREPEWVARWLDQGKPHA